MKKLYLLIALILSFFIIFLIILYIPKNYKINYEINKVNINESYDKKIKNYQLNLKYNNVNYPLIVNKEYTKNRKLIKSINIISEDKYVCLIIKLDKQTYNLCSYKDNLIDYHLIDKKIYQKYFTKSKETDLNKKYQKINIYNYNNNKYIIWNYNGLISLSENKDTIIKFLSNDDYDNKNAYQFDNYLLIPNYDSKYYFKKYYLYKFLKNEIFEIDFDYEISYELSYLGGYKNEIYFVDKKNNHEYTLNFKKNSIKQIDKNAIGKILENNKLTAISIKKIVNNNIKFTNNNTINYKIIDNKLYMVINNQNIKISNQKVTSIVSFQDENVFYLSSNTLYQFNYVDGETKLLSYSEWEFNNNNQIFIYINK